MLMTVVTPGPRETASPASQHDGRPFKVGMEASNNRFFLCPFYPDAAAAAAAPVTGISFHLRAVLIKVVRILS